LHCRSSIGLAGCRIDPRPAPTSSCGRADTATALFVCLHNAGRSQMSAALFAREAARVRELVAELDASDAG
jgi:hypothetical protein